MAFTLKSFTHLCDVKLQKDKTLTLEWQESFRKKKIMSKHLSWVYLFVIDNKVYKIGKTDNCLGISALINGYCKGVFKDRAKHGKHLRKMLAGQSSVRVYGHWVEPQRVTIEMYDGTTVETLVRVGRDMEKYALDSYKATYGC